MSGVKPLYLTCTASQAQEFNADNPHGFRSLNELLETRAQSHSDLRLAGFPELASNTSTWTVLYFTFSSLLTASNLAALHYVEATTMQPRSMHEKKDRIIALLSPSCADFLVTLFGALRLGYGVLLLAPQNTDEAIAHLCKITSSTHLICHPTLYKQGYRALGTNQAVCIVQICPRGAWQNVQSNRPLVEMALSPSDETDLTALVMHTSGSTGMPKPIYHPHRIWTEALPCIPWKPAFTTTPLFHGGSADILRSMNALSTLYLFSSIYPMTVTNVVNAVSACPDTAAFLSVPYILKMLAEDVRGMKLLQLMDLVSVGGAPLPEQLGDQMVRQGVKLVSRLGSSECGFLMSSHRDYDKDLEWSWLRNDGLGLKLLRFEPVVDSDDMFELVVSKSWSTRVVSNREDGSFATGDLYVKHLNVPNAWKYCGRADDIIVMMNGKKASANAIETKLRASPNIAEAIVFGASRPMLGVLVVPASSSTSLATITQCVHEVNACSAPYAVIVNDMIIHLPHNTELPKTSKGSIIRPRTLQQYANVIDETYRRFEEGTVDGRASEIMTHKDLKDYVRRLVMDALASVSSGESTNINDDDDLFALGLTSLHAAQIRGSLQKIVFASSGQALGNNVVFEYPSIHKLVEHVLHVKAGIHREDTSEQQQYTLMKNLLARFGTFKDGLPDRYSAIEPECAGVAILTGTTGALGAHILVQLVLRTRLHVVALVRARNDEEALDRLYKNLAQRKLDALDKTRFHAVAATLPVDHWGLPEDVYQGLLGNTELIIHAAWPVNFAYGLESFEPVLKGTKNLLDFAASTRRRAKVVFCSSIAAVANEATSVAQTVPETLSRSENGAAAMGYARSKWVAEHMCNLAYQSPALAGRVVIARIGQLCGDTQHGIWNEREGWPLLIATVKHTGCLPMFEEGLSWLPLDTAAEAIVDISLTSYPDKAGEVPVYHVLHSACVMWSTLLDYFDRSGLAFKRVRPAVWLEKLLTVQDKLDSPTRNLQSLWEQKYLTSGEEIQAYRLPFEVTNAETVSRALKAVSPISLELVQKIVNGWRASGFIY